MVDCHKDELTEVKQILKDAMLGIGDEMQTRFGYTPIVPFDIEISAGNNWLEQVELVLTDAT